MDLLNRARAVRALARASILALPLALPLALAVGSCSNGSEAPRRFATAPRERAQATAAQVDATRLRDHVVALVRERTLDTPENLPWSRMPLTRQRAGDYVIRTLTALGYAPVIEVSQRAGGGGEIRNIYVDIPGVRTPSEMVILSGHYDAWFASGADDNASAIAAMLEAARVLKDTAPSRTIRILAFDREEEGLVGSERYALDHASDRVVLMLNLDSIGYASSAPRSQQAPTGLTLKDTGDFLAALVNEPASPHLSRFAALSRDLSRPVEIVGAIAPRDGYTPATADFLRSDHTAYWRRGIPALFLTDTANFRNPNYHTVRDLPETLDYDFLHRSSQLIVGALSAFAEE